MNPAPSSPQPPPPPPPQQQRQPHCNAPQLAGPPPAQPQGYSLDYPYPPHHDYCSSPPTAPPRQPSYALPLPYPESVESLKFEPPKTEPPNYAPEHALSFQLPEYAPLPQRPGYASLPQWPSYELALPRPSYALPLQLPEFARPSPLLSDLYSPEQQGPVYATLPEQPAYAALPQRSGYVTSGPEATVTSYILHIENACGRSPTDQRALIKALAGRNGATIDKIRRQYVDGDLIRVLEQATSGSFCSVLRTTALGRIDSLVYWAHRAMEDARANGEMLIEALIGRTSAELGAMELAYARMYEETLVGALKRNLSEPAKDFFLSAIAQISPPDPSAPPDYADVRLQASTLHSASTRHWDRGAVVAAFTELMLRNDAQIQAVVLEYRRCHGELLHMVQRTLTGPVKDAIAFFLEVTLSFFSSIHHPPSVFHHPSIFHHPYKKKNTKKN